MGFQKTLTTLESAAIYVADDLINENAKIAVYDPKVSRKKMLADLDYLESRTTEKNTNSMQSFENPYEACKEAHAIAVLTEWDEFVSMIGNAYMILCFVFDGRNILNGSGKNRIVYQSIGS
jgi:UDPglucose 6-dehydrogenase